MMRNWNPFIARNSQTFLSKFSLSSLWPFDLRTHEADFCGPSDNDATDDLSDDRDSLVQAWGNKPLTFTDDDSAWPRKPKALTSKSAPSRVSTYLSLYIKSSLISLGFGSSRNFCTESSCARWSKQEPRWKWSIAITKAYLEYSVKYWGCGNPACLFWLSPVSFTCHPTW